MTWGNLSSRKGQCGGNPVPKEEIYWGCPLGRDGWGDPVSQEGTTQSDPVPQEGRDDVGGTLSSRKAGPGGSPGKGHIRVTRSPSKVWQGDLVPQGGTHQGQILLPKEECPREDSTPGAPTPPPSGCQHPPRAARACVWPQSPSPAARSSWLSRSCAASRAPHTRSSTRRTSSAPGPARGRCHPFTQPRGRRGN